MFFAASEYHLYFQLRPCSLRAYLNAKGVKRADPDAYHQLLVKLGNRHEQRNLARLGSYFDAVGDVEETRKAVERGERVIYQPEMRIRHLKYGDVVGRPDF